MFPRLRGVEPAGNRSTAGSWLTLRRLRRLSQILFLALFGVLLCQTGSGGRFQPGDADYRLSYPVRLFLETDPFVAVTNALATRSLYRGLLWSLAILIPALFLGRFFCGWICPLGTLHHCAGAIRSERKSGRRRIDANRYKPWQAFKYYLLFALLAAALAGSALGGIFDPIALAVRAFGLSVLPAWNYALGHSGPHFRQAFLLGVILIFLIALNLRITRFWCRALCPLGALLGLASRWSILGLEKHPGNCGDCNRCLLHCQGGDDPIPGAPWRKAECHLCLNCVADCPDGAIRFRFFPRKPATAAGVDLKRRRILAGAAAGAAALPLLRANTGLTAEPHPRRIRPPAALEEPQFLARCIRCGECMKVCPNNALHPALAEAGWEGIWTPVLAARVGYCEPACTLCGQVCPTGAIWEFTVREKGWATGETDVPAYPPRHRILRPRPLPALGHGHRMRGVRGVVPDFAQSHLPPTRRRHRCRRRDQTNSPAVPRPGALRRLRRLRVCLPGERHPGDCRHQRGREPLEGQPDPAQPPGQEQSPGCRTPATHRDGRRPAKRAGLKPEICGNTWMAMPSAICAPASAAR